VDVTRMDLSQFDERASSAGRSIPTTPHSPSPPDIIGTAGSLEELEQAQPFIEATEGADVVPAAEATHR